MKHLQKLGYITIGAVLTIAVMGTALAATGALTIEVNPINVQVNGQTFQPKDAQGNSVPVFAYNGTTYAPLRALAEAYGLEVGYDAGKNMATVGAKAADPTTAPTPDTTVPTDYSDWTAEEEAAYQEFKGMWSVRLDEDPNSPIINVNGYEVSKPDVEQNIDAFLTSNTVTFIEKCCYRLDSELYQQYKKGEIAYHFMLRGSWGWLDIFSSNGWQCGYANFLEKNPHKAAN